MENFTTTGGVGLTLDSLGGYYGGRGGYNSGTNVGNGLLALQNLRTNDKLGDVACDVSRGTDQTKSWVTTTGLFASAAADRRIDSLNASNNARFSILDAKADAATKAFYERELAKADRDSIIEAGKLNAVQSELNAFRFPQPATAAGLPLAGQACGGGIDINAIQIAVGNGIAQGMANLAGILKP